MTVGDIISGLLMFLKKYWYVFVLIVGGIVIIKLLIDKGKKKVEYWSQVEVNRQLKFREMEFNPTRIKKILYKGKKLSVLGEQIRPFFKGTKGKVTQKMERQHTPQEIKNFELENMKNQVKDDPVWDYAMHDFLIKMGGMLGMGGKKEVLRIRHDSFTRPKFDTLRLNDTVTIVYRDGFFMEFGYEMITIQREDTERLMKDLTIDSTGQQQKDFSRIRTDYAHQELMKDKDAEVEKEKQEGRKIGGR